MALTPPGLQYPETSGMEQRMQATLKNIFDNLTYLRASVVEINTRLDAIEAEIVVINTEIEELQP